MTHTPVFLSFRSSGLRRSAALAILPLFLASCGSSTSTASKYSRTLEHNRDFLPVSFKRHRVRFLFRGEEDLHPLP